jgi:hypothetical protein
MAEITTPEPDDYEEALAEASSLPEEYLPETVLVDERAVALVGNEGVPTQVANPSRASWRTFVQSIVPTLAVLNIALPLVYGFLIENADQIGGLLGPVYGWITIGVNTAAVAIALLAKLNAVIMANPRINAAITNGPWWISWLAPIKAVK